MQINHKNERLQKYKTVPWRSFPNQERRKWTQDMHQFKLLKLFTACVDHLKKYHNAYYARITYSSEFYCENLKDKNSKQ